MKTFNDHNILVDIKIEPVMKFIVSSKQWLCFFYTQNERIQIQDHGSYSLIASVELGDKKASKLIGIINKNGVRFQEDYNGEVKDLKNFIQDLDNKLLLLTAKNSRDELDIPTDQIQEDRI